ncbi:MAG: efflux RND transporter periplasmic adaptor subunit [Planctomycetota bacterium]|jgi:cobalt-zinc-cadmium efflux system membrane fusion protein|nr:efflux RND transporter periplasmic adaptor subunit [Planctomycetota bacterium]
MKTWLIGFAVLTCALGSVITADQMGLLRATPNTSAPPSTVSNQARAVATSSASGEATAPAEPAPEDLGERLLRPPSPTCSKAETPIIFGHGDVASQAGISIVTVRPHTGGATVSATGRIAFPTNRHATLASRADGIVAEVAVDLGQAVEAGTVLLRIDSSALGRALAQLHQAQSQLGLWQQTAQRHRQLSAEGIGRAAELTTAESRLREAEAELDAARQTLHTLGLSTAELTAALAGETIDQHLLMRAPFAGSVIAVEAAPGEHCARGEVLVTVADTAQVWALLDVPERDLNHVRLGQQIAVRSDAGGGDPVVGQVTWIAPTVDARTRTVPVRVELNNADAAFRSGQFVVAAIPQAGDAALSVISRDAVQWDGCCNVVFVPGASDHEFRVRKIQVDHRAGTEVAIAEGLKPGEQVVTTGSWLLKTEILKGSIGAGCCEVH